MPSATDPSATTATPPTRRRPTLGQILLVALGALMLLLVIGAATRLGGPGSQFVVAPASTSRWWPAPTLVLVVLGLVCVGAAGLVPGRRGRMSPRTHRLLWAAFFALVLAGQLVLARAVLQNPPYDAAQVFTAAYTNAVAPGPRLFSASTQADYFAMYPNNVLLVGFFTTLFGVLRAIGLEGQANFLLAAVVVDCVALTGSFAGACWIAHRVSGPRAALVVAALGLPLLGVSPWIDVPYSDVLAMPFPVAAVVIRLAWPRGSTMRSTAAMWAIIGVVAAIGFSIKPTTVFAFGAVLAVDVWRSRRARGWRRAATALVATAAAFAAVQGAIALAPSQPVSAVGSVPFPHYLAMGAIGDGGFNQQDLDATMALPPAERSRERFAVWQERAAEKGPLGYPVFLVAKALYALSDGGFFQGREGVGAYSTAFLSGDRLSAAVQSVHPLAAPGHPALATVWQAAWWIALALCFVVGRQGLGGSATALRSTLRIALILLLVFLCFSESRSRYLYHYVPLVLVLAAIGASVLSARVQAVSARLGSRSRPGRG